MSSPEGAKISKRYSQPMKELRNFTSMKRHQKNTSEITEDLRNHINSSLLLPVLASGSPKIDEMESVLRVKKSPNISSLRDHIKSIRSPNPIRKTDDLFNKSELCLYLK